jgi:2'-5' RNA ligase
MPERKSEIQRVFFALWPDDVVRAELRKISGVIPDSKGKRVPPENFHITLAFLGNVDRPILQCAIDAAGSIRGEPFEIRLDSLDWWKRPKIIWLGATSIPSRLTALESSLSESLTQCGYKRDHPTYRPHLTLFRKAGGPPGSDPIQAVDWRIESFSLIESVTHPDGVQYREIQRWALGRDR